MGFQQSQPPYLKARHPLKIKLFGYELRLDKVEEAPIDQHDIRAARIAISKGYTAESTKALAARLESSGSRFTAHYLRKLIPTIELLEQTK